MFSIYYIMFILLYFLCFNYYILNTLYLYLYVHSYLYFLYLILYYVMFFKQIFVIAFVMFVSFLYAGKIFASRHTHIYIIV